MRIRVEVGLVTREQYGNGAYLRLVEGAFDALVDAVGRDLCSAGAMDPPADRCAANPRRATRLEPTAIDRHRLSWPATRDHGGMATVSVRYIVDDVDAAIGFYTRHLGFTEVMHPAPAFAMLVRGDLRLTLSAPGTQGGGGQAAADGSLPHPGGWNRFALEFDGLDDVVALLRAAGVFFRTGMVTGVGGRQVLIEDPAGNPVELFEPSIPEARLG